MKRTLLFTLTFSIILNIFNLGYCAENKSLRAKFTKNDIAGTSFKEITITPYDYDDDEDEDEEKTYYIYLPSGYFVEGTSASYVADRNGKYPFTVYDGRYKNTFIHTVNDIDENLPSEDKKDKDNDEITFNYELKYDYEKKQVLFYMKLDKLRNVITPGSKIITNEVNYFIKSLDNNTPFDFTVIIDDEPFNYKLIKQGEYYLLIYISPVNYNDYSTVVEYYGYNFTNNREYSTIPSKDIYDDNGKYEVLVKSDTSQQIFNFNINGIDYRRPSVDIEFYDDDTFNLEFEDDFEIDYIITFDGKYKDINNIESYNHPTPIKYRGDYIFTVVDEKGNRTVEYAVINKPKRKPSKHAIDLDVHDESKITDYLFENIGLKYKKQDDETKYFENILPAYMNGKSPESFNPDSPISRAEMITIFCRLNNLPYDTNAYLKSKFTDIDNHWAKDYISMGSSKKYVSGYKDKTFKPDNNVTRAEFCQMLTKISAYKSLLNAIPASSNYTYNDISSHWAEKEIIKISSRDLVISSGTYFYPDKPITRGEVVHAINKLYGYNPSYIELGHINSLYNKHYNFEDIRQHKFYNDIIISVVGMYREIIE